MLNATAFRLLFSAFLDAMQARIAALLKEHPVAGQSFCRMLVAPFIHYMDSGKGKVHTLFDSPLKSAQCLSLDSCWGTRS